MTTKDTWEKWNEERDRFNARETMGFSRDLDALEAHIKKLTRVCPKDEAGWPTGKALTVIDSLRRDYDRFKRYLDIAKS